MDLIIKIKDLYFLIFFNKLIVAKNPVFFKGKHSLHNNALERKPWLLQFAIDDY